MSAWIPNPLCLNQNNMPATKFLRDVELFMDCSEHFLQDIFALSEEVGYLPGEILREAGRENTYIFVVIVGNVHIVDGKDTVLHENDVIGIYSQINKLSVCVYTAYAATEGAICMRVSRELLDTMLVKYPQDKVIIMRNTLKFVHRRPRGHVLAAMQKQVSNFGNQFMTNVHPNVFSYRKRKSKSAPNVLEFPESTKAHSTLEIKRNRQNSLTAFYVNTLLNVQLNEVLMAEHADRIAIVKFPKTRRHSETLVLKHASFKYDFTK